MNKVCKNCGQGFVITDEDIEFYQDLELPIPSICPEDRYKKRLLFRNERNFYKRKCDATGVDIISIYSQDKKIKVYKHDYWWGDKWNALNFGRDFDFSQLFFEQFKALFYEVPQIQLNNSRSINSEYTNQSHDNKNCYLLVACSNNENCYYGMWNEYCKNCCDCLYLEKSELCYEVLNGKNCYKCLYSENLENCSDCIFCKNCIGCRNCFGSMNLRNKEYFFQNEKCTKKEYLQKIEKLNFTNYDAVAKLKNKFKEFTHKFPHKYYNGKNIQNSTGDYLQEVKNTFASYNCCYCEDIKYCYDVWNAKICYDLTETIKNERSVQLEGCNTTFNCAFGMKLDNSYNLFYCSHCYSCNNCFGCVGLRNSNYCILNKKYSKEEYEDMRGRIIKKLKETREWGEYFPESISPFDYPETVAQDYFPIKNEINGIVDKKFRLVEAEKAFYKKLGIPIPKKHPDLRHKERLGKRNPRYLWERECIECGEKIMTTFSSEMPEKIYCEKCYLSCTN